MKKKTQITLLSVIAILTVITIIVGNHKFNNQDFENHSVQNESNSTKEEKEESDESLINVIKNNDVINIYVPSKENEDRYIGFSYERITQEDASLDTWVQYKVGIYNRVGKTYRTEFMISPGNSDNEGVLFIQGESDFVGGLHGYDIMESLEMTIDGESVDLEDNFNKDAKEITITNQSRVLHDETEDEPENKAFTRHKKHTWTLDNMILEGEWIAENDITVSSSKLSDFSVTKEDNGTEVIKWGKNDLSDEETNVSKDFKDKGVEVHQHGIEEQSLWGKDSDFKVSLATDWDTEQYPNSYGYIEDFGDRAKIYFDLTGSYTFDEGESIKYKNTYTFDY